MKKVSLGLTLFLTFVLVATIIAGCTPAPKPEAPKTEKVTYTIVMLGDLSGPGAVTTGPQMEGTQDFAKWSNETNYIPVITMNIKIFDHGYDMDNAVALYKQGVTETPAPVMTNGGIWSTVAPTLAGLAKQNKIPIIDPSSIKDALYPPGWFFGYQPSYEGQLGAYINWIAENWKADSKVDWIKKHYENRKPRLALIGWDNSMGRAFESVETKCYAQAKGVEWVGSDYVPLMVGDVTPQLTRLKGKVDFLFAGMFGSAWQAVLKKAAELEMRDQFIDVGASYFSPPEIATFTPDLVNNNGAVGIFVAMFDEYPKVIQEAQLKTRYPIEFGSYAVGWYNGDLYAEVLRQTANRVGADKITGPAIYDMLCAGGITKFKPMISVHTVTWSNNSKLVKMDGADSCVIRIVQNYDPKVLKPEQTHKAYVNFPDVPIPAVLPGGKDVPANCK